MYGIPLIASARNAEIYTCYVGNLNTQRGTVGREISFLIGERTLAKFTNYLFIW